MTQPTAAQTAQALIEREGALLAERGRITMALDHVDKDLAGVRAAIEGVKLGQQLAQEIQAAAQASPQPSE